MARAYDVLPQRSPAKDSMLLGHMDSPKQRTTKRLALAGLVFFLFLVYAILSDHSFTSLCRDCIPRLPSQLPYQMDAQSLSRRSHPNALNSTLGFQQIYVLSMPDRRDKRAEQTLLANLYGYSIEFVDGLNLASARPELDNEHLGELGCAEGHARVWQTMLKNNIQTALIFEDDFDFSRKLREQLELFREPLATYLQLFTGNQTRLNNADPYNAALWDTLWLGHCGDRAWNVTELPTHHNGRLPYLTYTDPTRPPVEDKVLQMYKAYGLPTSSAESLRVIQPNRDTWCLSGYAITTAGARKSLYKNAHKGAHAGHIDFDVMMLAREKRLRTFSLSPPLFAHRQPLSGEDSDRAHKHVKTLPGREGKTTHIGADSARMHLSDDILLGTQPLIWQVR